MTSSNRFPTLLSLCAGKPQVKVASPHKGTVTRTFDVFVISLKKNSVEQTLDWPVFREAMTIIWHRRNVLNSQQGWGQVLLAVLESSTSTFQICNYKYKYSQYLDGIKYIKYFFNQVQVQVPSTLVTNNSTVSQYGSYWWPNAYLVPRHLKPSCWNRTVAYL